ncbi:TonB-dependent receptor [Novosphingobium sp. APW14]|uniref:TonB-dependent receptor n=1 Tax=Novosphingobium sp. APW14 TaxID=3077237 RepID=UPI0028DDFF23|nr:TonB-dependent receptor [Novosphingobium sp. APW14]MDT9013005.1 TonB-dependent receptor [Novosphingobium sp. APW14]
MNRFNARSTASILALATALGLAGTAHAAVTVTADAVFVDAPASEGGADEQQDAAAAPAATAQNDGLTDIVVTATKRETNLQRTPISISVMGSETIRERKVQSLLDLADGGVPSLRVAPFESRQSALTVGIRGIVPLDANQPAREQGVGIYIDGVYLGRQHGLNTGLFDVERVEVLKGPQGTLFGRNTEGGAVSIVSKAPTGEWGGRIDGSLGNIGSYNAGLHLNLPEVAGFSIKLDGVIAHQDAVTANPLADQAGWGQFHRKGLRAAVRWQPVDGITNDFSFDTAHDENSPFYSQLLNYNPNNCQSGGTNAAPLPIPAGSTCVTPGTDFIGTQGTIKPLTPGVVVNGTTLMRVADIGVPQKVTVDKTFGYTNVFKWKIAPEIELRSITAWRGVEVEQNDNAGGLHRVPVVNLTASCAGANCAFSRYSRADLNQRQFSQEIQAVGSIGSVDYVAGFYYFNERVSDDAATPNSMGATAVVTNGVVTGATFAPIPFCTGAAVPSLGAAVQGCSIDRASSVRSKSYAAYGQATWNASEQLHLTVGGRYTKDKKQGELLWSRGVNYAANPTVAATNGYTPLDKEWSRFNPMATLAYDFSNAVHAYAKYATGYRAGGASSRTSDYRAFNPEDVKSYEVGLKADLFDRRARLNLAAYLMDRKGSQVDLSTIQPTATGNFNNLVTFNAPGTTKIRGIEADLTVKPTDRLKFDLSYAYTYTDIPAVPVTYREFTSAGAPTGQSTTVLQKFYIVYTPRNAASASVDYELPLGAADTKIKFHVDANYSQATQSFDQFAVKADESFIVNARLSVIDIDVSGTKLNLGLWSRNVFDNQLVYRRDPSNSLPAVQSNAAAGVANITRVGNNNNIFGDYGNFNMPRTFGVDASIKF